MHIPGVKGSGLRFSKGRYLFNCMTGLNWRDRKVFVIVCREIAFLFGTTCGGTLLCINIGGLVVTCCIIGFWFWVKTFFIGIAEFILGTRRLFVCITGFCAWFVCITWPCILFVCITEFRALLVCITGLCTLPVCTTEFWAIFVCVNEFWLLFVWTKGAWVTGIVSALIRGVLDTLRKNCLPIERLLLVLSIGSRCPISPLNPTCFICVVVDKVDGSVTLTSLATLGTRMSVTTLGSGVVVMGLKNFLGRGLLIFTDFVIVSIGSGLGRQVKQQCFLWSGRWQSLLSQPCFLSPYSHP